MLMIIRLECIFWFAPFFPTLMPILFWAYFVLHEKFLLLLLIEHGFVTRRGSHFKKDSGILYITSRAFKYIVTFLIDI